MGDFVNVLYKEFFLRDILGKIVPGTLVLISLFLFDPQEGLKGLVGSILPYWSMKWIWLISSYFLGLGLQVLGELLGLLSAHPRPFRIFFYITEKGKKARESFRFRQVKFQEFTNKYQKEQRERYVYLKEGSGNVAFGLLLLAGAYVYKTCILEIHPLNCILVGTILSVAIVLGFAHCVHRSRQAYYEKKVLGSLGDPDDEKQEKDSRGETKSGGERINECDPLKKNFLKEFYSEFSEKFFREI